MGTTVLRLREHMSGEKKQKKTFEQRLFEAFHKDRGIKLSKDDIYELVGFDDAIRRRITKAAGQQAGIQDDLGDEVANVETWTQFKRRLKAAAST